MAQKLNSAVGIALVILFALPFACFGVFMGGWAAKNAIEWYSAGSWIETPCVVRGAEIEQHNDGEGGSTSEAITAYEYEYAGVKYRSNRVAIHTGADNIGSFQTKRGEQLEQVVRQGSQFRCFVNPDDPSEAILFRDLRLGMILVKLLFALMFGGVGLGIIVAALLSTRKKTESSAAKQIELESPWLQRDDWAAGRISSSHKAKLKSAWAFTILWNALSWPGVVGAAMKDDLEYWVVAIVALFPIVGIGMIVYAFYITRRAAKWGTSEFEMAAVPGVIGGRLTGVIHAPAGLGRCQGVELTLTCFQQRTRRTGDGQETYYEPLWQTDRTIVRMLSDRRDPITAIPVGFHIPYTCLPTSDADKRSWKLEARAATPGVDYYAEFEVPVFETVDSSPNDSVEDYDALEAYAAPVTLASVVKRCRGRVVRDTRQRRVVEFPMMRNVGLSLSSCCFSLIWTSICVGLWMSPAPVMFPIVFSIFGVVLVLASMSIVLDRSTVDLDRRRVLVRSGSVGRTKQYEFERARVRSIVAEACGTRSGSTVYQHVLLKPTSGKDVKLVGQIARRSDAESLAEQFQQILGLEDQNAKPAAPIESLQPVM